MGGHGLVALGGRLYRLRFLLLLETSLRPRMADYVGVAQRSSSERRIQSQYGA